MIDRETRDHIVNELATEFHAKMDGRRRNLIFPNCPYCGHAGGKFGLYIGPETGSKKLFMGHCFSCGKTEKDINKLLSVLGRPDLKIEEFASFAPLEVPAFYSLHDEELIDDTLEEVEMPEGWKRCFRNSYLHSRGFEADDYTYFPVGTTRGLNFKFDDYVVFPIIDNGVIVGYVARHVWSKHDIDEYNFKAKAEGKYEIRRYNNSNDRNPFSKLLYNYDAVIEDETDTVIVVEGVFDVIALTRKLELYDNTRLAVVATFGKKISKEQIFKLQTKGVRTVVIGYDADAVESIKKVATELNEYFDVYVAAIQGGKDWDEMDWQDIYETMAYRLKTPVEYKLNMVQA